MDCKEKPAVQICRFGQHLGGSLFFSTQPEGPVRGGKGCDRCGGASASPGEAKGSAALTRTTSFFITVERQFLPALAGQKLRSTRDGNVCCASAHPPLQGGGAHHYLKLCASSAPAYNNDAHQAQVCNTTSLTIKRIKRICQAFSQLGCRPGIFGIKRIKRRFL